jgi:hypothetical protein
MSKLKSVTFAAVVPEFAPNGTYMGTVVKRVEFNIGPGPCGEVVTGLAFGESVGWIAVCQETEASEKTFRYRVQDVVGRVVITRTD